MTRHTSFRLATVVALTATAALLGIEGIRADSKEGQVISASVDFASDQITIVGRHLPRRPSVKLG